MGVGGAGGDGRLRARQAAERLGRQEGRQAAGRTASRHATEPGKEPSQRQPASTREHPPARPAARRTRPSALQLTRAAKELAVDVDLREGGPLAELLHACGRGRGGAGRARRERGRGCWAAPAPAEPTAAATDTRAAPGSPIHPNAARRSSAQLGTSQPSADSNPHSSTAPRVTGPPTRAQHVVLQHVHRHVRHAAAVQDLNHRVAEAALRGRGRRGPGRGSTQLGAGGRRAGVRCRAAAETGGGAARQAAAQRGRADAGRRRSRGLPHHGELLGALDECHHLVLVNKLLDGVAQLRLQAGAGAGRRRRVGQAAAAGRVCGRGQGGPGTCISSVRAPSIGWHCGCAAGTLVRRQARATGSRGAGGGGAAAAARPYPGPLPAACTRAGCCCCCCGVASGRLQIGPGSPWGPGPKPSAGTLPLLLRRPLRRCEE